MTKDAKTNSENQSLPSGGMTLASKPSQPAETYSVNQINIIGARQNNLKNISISIPKNQLVVVTGPSGSGKSSLAFDTIYTEGRRRYVESLSVYARQFLNIQGKSDFDSISGLSPAIAIDQKTSSKSPRSTVATMTEIYDYLRVLFARIGVPFSPITGKPISSQSSSEIIQEVMKLPDGAKFKILAPVIKGQKGEHKKLLINLRRQGYEEARFDGEYTDLDSISIKDKKTKHSLEVVIDKIEKSDNIKSRISSSIETALNLSEGILQIDITHLPGGKDSFSFSETRAEKVNTIITFSEKFACPVSGFSISEIEPRIFSFNSPYGACQACDGLGTEYYFSPDLIIPDPEISIDDGGIAPWASMSSNKFYYQMLTSMGKHFGFSTTEPIKNLSEKTLEMLLYGLNGKEFLFEHVDGVKKNSYQTTFNGVINILHAKWREAESEIIKQELEKYQDITRCHKCNGYRLRKESLQIKINNQHIGEVCRKTIETCIEWFKDLPNHLNAQHKEISDKVLKEIIKRMIFLQNVGLSYLTLSRESATLSGGESQRVRLASQIGSELTGVMYILDEPSIGLHQSDNEKLIKTLKHLKNLGNTVIVVEHDEETMLAADYLIDVGPGAGEYGGNIIACGTPEEVMQNDDSITGRYLSGKECIMKLGARKRIGKGKHIEILNATSNNLKGIDVKIPLGMFCCVTGISGGGKSSLIIHTLYRASAKRFYNNSAKPGAYSAINGLEYIDKVIEIDQSPIGRTPRSNPATYTSVFTHIRDWFTNLPESRKRGYRPSRFSFNVKGGRCEACQGDGIIKFEMHFLPDVYIPCDVCKGAKYNTETLEVKYMGKSISDVLNLSIKDAHSLFKGIPVITDKLKCLIDVGLEYMKLGQPATTLSGGESQRIKLAKELSKKETGNTLYILDEPTTGLHAGDISKLLNVLQLLVDNGNTMVIIEHNMDVIKTSDYVIDIGPFGGDRGGELVVAGTPEEVADCPESLTGKFLKPYLERMKKFSRHTIDKNRRIGEEAMKEFREEQKVSEGSKAKKVKKG